MRYEIEMHLSVHDNDAEGAHITVRPDQDGLGCVEILTENDKQSAEYWGAFRFAIQPAMARQLASRHHPDRRRTGGRMKLYLSKYALTGAIEEVTLQPKHGEDPGVLPDDGAYVRCVERSWSLFQLGKGIHRTREGAIAAAETKRAKKLKSLQKQMDALRKKEFA